MIFNRGMRQFVGDQRPAEIARPRSKRTGGGKTNIINEGQPGLFADPLPERTFIGVIDAIERSVERDDRFRFQSINERNQRLGLGLGSGLGAGDRLAADGAGRLRGGARSGSRGT